VKTSIRRALGSVLAATTALTGALAMGSVTTADAAVVYADYGFEGSAFGTYISTGPVGVQSSRTAHSFIGCTRRIGVNVERHVAAAETPGVPKVLNIGAVDSFSRSYKKANGTVGTRSQSVVAGVRLGDPNGLNIGITALKTRTDAFATKAGKFGTAASFDSVDISANTGIPEIDTTLNAAGATLSDLITLITDSANDVLTIPGLGEIKLGGTRHRKFYNFAEANAVALNVQLYGANAVKGGGDDVIVRVGRARSRITRNLTSGVFRGFAQPATVKLLDGLLRVGPLGEQRLACRGTNGEVRSNAVAGVDLLQANQLKIGAVKGSAFGEQYDNGSARAWTRSTIAGIELGSGSTSIKIEGITGRANVTKWRSGTVTRGIGGSKVAEIFIGGTKVPLPALGTGCATDPQSRCLEVAGVAKIEFMVVAKPTRRDIKVTAVRITLLGDAATETGVAVINLGVAKAGIKDF
jgi:hypothetical protein